MVKNEIEEQVKALARAAKWEELSAYINDHISKPKPEKLANLSEAGISDDEKRRMISDCLIEWFHK